MHIYEHSVGTRPQVSPTLVNQYIFLRMRNTVLRTCRRFTITWPENICDILRTDVNALFLFSAFAGNNGFLEGSWELQWVCYFVEFLVTWWFHFISRTWLREAHHIGHEGKENQTSSHDLWNSLFSPDLLLAIYLKLPLLQNRNELEPFLWDASIQETQAFVTSLSQLPWQPEVSLLPLGKIPDHYRRPVFDSPESPHNRCPIASWCLSPHPSIISVVVVVAKR